MEALPITWTSWSHGAGFSGMIGQYHVADVSWADGSYRVRLYLFNCSSSWKGFSSFDRAKAFAQRTLAEKLEEILV